MNMMRPESQEHQVTKTGDHNQHSSHKFHEQYHDLMHPGKEHANSAAKAVTKETNSVMNEAKAVANGISHLDIPQLWNNGVHQVESSVSGAAKQAWDNADKDPNQHWVKHDLCNDNPVAVGIAAASATGVAVLAGVLLAPEAAAAAGIGAAEGTVGGIIGGLGSIGLKINWDNHHSQPPMQTQAQG
jgi:hypothetical protein